MKHKVPRANLRIYYPILFQFGLILSLGTMLAVTNISLPGSKMVTKAIIFDVDYDSIDLPQPILPEHPPAPMKPLIPVEVADETIIEDEPDIPNLEIDSFFYTIPQSPTEKDEEEVFDSFGVEVLPSMLGGLQELYAELRYPDWARKAGVEGIVTVQFIVNKLGEVENPEILRGIGGGCDEEVLRVIRGMKFSPGVQNGIFVNLKMAQSVRFQLQN